jgi:desulfoferrodoxin (superoxide reductase-like protein)
VVCLSREWQRPFVYLPHEGVEAKAEFPDVAHGTVYAFCNMHGLWKAEF